MPGDGCDEVLHRGRPRLQSVEHVIDSERLPVAIDAPGITFRHLLHVASKRRGEPRHSGALRDVG